MARTRTRSAWITTTRTSKRGGTYAHWRRVRVSSELLFTVETARPHIVTRALNQARPLAHDEC